MRKTIISLVVGVALFVPTAILADGMPGAKEAPKGSGSPSNAPAGTPADTAGGKVTQADLQADAPDKYTVVKGDTLWGISGKFLKDPWKWPQVWNLNRDQIKDPHWIYPGDVIKLDRNGPSLSVNSRDGVGADGNVGPSGGTSAEAVANVVKLDPRIRTEPLEEAIPSIPGNAIGPFLTRPLIAEAGALQVAPQILAVEENRVLIGAGDAAYVDRIGTQ